MITAFKIFENKENRKYWLLPTDDRFEDALKIIGCNPTYAENVLLVMEDRYDDDFLYVSYNPTIPYNIRWGWSDFVYDDGKLTDIWYENNGFNFMGLVNIDETEVRSKIEANKYNL